MTFRRRRLLPALALHFGWHPEQVGRLTMHQLTIYRAVVNGLSPDFSIRRG